MKKLLFFLIIIVILGCSIDYKVKVSSNTSWSGYFDNRTVEGYGNKTVNVSDEGTVCATAQKETEEGYLKLKMVEYRKGLFSGETTVDKAETTAAYGVVSVCN